jgi:p-hydroxybenzoate 3-monooxygenase
MVQRIDVGGGRVVKESRTQVVIVGAGPAGLFLGHLLQQGGIDNVIVERRSREYVERRVRAGVIEHGVANSLDEAGVGERMRREGLLHHGVEFRFDHASHRVALSELTNGKTITVYGQQELVKDLIALRLGSGADIHFDTEATLIDDHDGDLAVVEGVGPAGPFRMTSDYVAGCDGSFGVANQSLPSASGRRYERVYPFAWLGILAEAAPTSEELIYCRHERGFALCSMRSPTLSRLYLGVAPSENLDEWSDDRIWDELNRRLATESSPDISEGPIIERSLTAMRSVVVAPMRSGRLLTAGDAAHIVPPTGAKGMNLALADIRRLAPALIESLTAHRHDLLDAYSATCLERVWRAEEFSNYMTQMLHPLDDDEFENEVQTARLRQMVSSAEASTVFARNYTDLNTL